MIFGYICRRSADIRLLKDLLERAERYALDAGEQAPGAAHMLAAAVDLPDGSGRRAFERAGIEADAYRTALQARHSETLRGLGLPQALAALVDAGPPAVQSPVYEAAPSGQGVIRRLADTRACRRGRAMIAADVVAAVASEPDRLGPAVAG